MLLTLVALLLLVLAPVCAWAVRSGGARRLWLVCSVSLAVIVVLGLALAKLYAVPDARRLLLYALTLFAPSVLLTALLLTLLDRTGRLQNSLLAGYAASALGLGIGFFVVVYVLGIW